MIRRPPRSTLDRSSAASDVYKRQVVDPYNGQAKQIVKMENGQWAVIVGNGYNSDNGLSLIHISEPTRPY